MSQARVLDDRDLKRLLLYIQTQPAPPKPSNELQRELPILPGRQNQTERRRVNCAF